MSPQVQIKITELLNKLKRYEGIARLLIENGAEPSLQNRYNKTAFDYGHNLKILQVLKSCTPNLYEYIHITSTDVKTLNCKPSPVAHKLQKMKINENNNVSKAVENLKLIDRILKAISYGDIKLACFYMNINYSAYVDMKDKPESSENSTSCHPLCECSVCKKNTKSYSSDFDINLTDTNSFTALHYAARYGSDELCKILIHNKANVNCINKKNQTPLHLAALNNKTHVIRLLLDSGANINAIDMAGNTPMHDVCAMGNIGAAKILLSYNPDLSMLNGADKTALTVAKEKVHLTIIDLIDKYTSGM